MTACDILVFDDDAAGVVPRLEILKQAGYSVQWHPDANDVLRLVKEMRPRLVILDVVMPGMDGISACKVLRGAPELKDLRVLVVSCRDDSFMEKDALSHGADLFLRKPMDLARFAGQVRDLIGPPGA